MSPVYVESSALTKLVREERESAEMGAALAGERELVTSELSTLEVGRAARRSEGDAGLARARAVMLRFEQIPVDRAVIESAQALDPPSLRSLDAIHVATALTLETPDVVFYAYDRRTIEAAESNGLTVASPGA